MVAYIPGAQTYLFNHMSNFVDYRSDKEPQLCFDKNSIYYFIFSNPEFSRFRDIVERAQMVGFLDDLQLNATIFIPTNQSLSHIPEDFFQNLDTGLARQIVASSTIPKKLAKDLLTASPVSYIYTRNPNMRMYITNINGKTRINNCISVTHYDIWKSNGIIHIVDGLIVPNEDHFMN